jgi:hypothetical protein
VATRPISELPRFAPAERPRIAIASDGSLAAIAERSRIVVVTLPGGAVLAEIGADPGASATELGWVGPPARLVVLSRHGGHSSVHLVDPYGPRSLAEIRLESPMRLYATVGPHALAAGAQGAAVLTAGEAHLVPYQFPARGIPLAAGPAGGQFLVALPGGIEEWDPQARMPKRRLRLPRPAAITALGGSERVVWMTTQQEPARVDVIPLVPRGQPRAHDLPEPIAHASGHPRSDLLVCLGAQSHRLYVVDLDGKKPLRPLPLPGLEQVEAAGLAVGRTIAVLGAQAQRPLALVVLEEAPGPAEPPPAVATVTLAAVSPAAAARADDDDEPAEPPRPSTLTDPDFVAPAPSPSSPSSPSSSALAAAFPPVRVPAAAPSPVPAAAPSPVPVAAPAAAPAPAPSPVQVPTSAPLAAAPRPAAPLGFTTAAAPAPPSRQAAVGAPVAAPAAAADPARWRDDVVAWTRAVAAGVEREPPAAPAIDAIAARLELSPPLRRALILLYGAHLCGEPGAAPVDVARVCERGWDEALGRGKLAEARLAIYERSRVRLAAPVLRALDELPPVAGTLFGPPGSPALLAPWAAVAPGEPLEELAARLSMQIGGAILAARPGADPAELYLEARARGAVPLLRAGAEAAPSPTEPAILVVDDEAAAERLGTPIL